MQLFYKSIKTFFFCLLALQVSAQVSFSNRNDLLTNSDFHSGVAISVVDMNNDGLDDIVRLSDGNFVEIQYQQAGNAAFTSLSVMGVQGDSQWSICVADVDNNGYNDILTGGRYDNIKILSANDTGTAYTLENCPGATIFAQASNMADINNDGFVDVFVCHDDGESRIWSNNGDGTFSEADNWIDMATTPASDNSGNYGSIWTDFDNDGDLDLYIAKCRGGVSDPTDPRRINALFVNDGNNNYTEAAEEYGLKIGAQSWTADFNDIDNDGDLDCFITNHDVGNMLFENDGTGHFTDISAESGISGSLFPIQGVMRDFDNDGFIDIMIAGGDHEFYHNNGDKTFTIIDGLFDNNDMESYGIGDLNNDGYLDIYGGYAEIYTTPSDIDDVLWLNDGGDNNFISVKLAGNQSNRSGIGARVEIYGDWGIQVREIRSGESYGIQNSQNAHFGLGQSTGIDSLIIRWPSGIIDKFEAVDINQLITVNEDNCISPSAAITIDGAITFCTGESVILSAPEGFEYAWSNGETSQSITVTEAGSYNVTIDDGTGCLGISGLISTVINPENIPTISMEGSTVLCAGSTVILTASEAESYLWSTGETTQSIEVEGTGIYSVSVPGLCGEFSSENFEPNVQVLTPAAPGVEGITLYEVSSTTLHAIGESLTWYDAVGNILSTTDSLVTPELTETTSYFVENTATFSSELDAGMPEMIGTNIYSGDQYNGETIFDCHEAFILKNVTVYTDIAATRIIELKDNQGTVLMSKTVDITAGEQVITLGFTVEPGNDLILTTNAENNVSEIGTTSPRLQRAQEGVNYPYLAENALTIKGSNLGDSYYYYFFNWQIETEGKECTSDAVEVVVELDVVGTKDIDQVARIFVSPNPTEGHFIIQLKQVPQKGDLIKIYNYSGILVKTQTIDNQIINQNIDLNNEPSGIYLLEVISDGKRYVGKVILE